MHLRFTHIAVCIGAFFGVAEYHFTVCLCHDLLIHSPGEGRLGCFQCLVVAEEKGCYKHYSQVLAQVWILFHLDKYLRVGFLDYMINVCLTVEETANRVSRVVALLCILQQCMRVPGVLCSRQHWALFAFLILDVLPDVW